MKKIITIFFLLFVMTSSLFAQTQVIIRLKPPPPNRLSSADLWSATITNSGESITAYLYGSMTNNADGEIIATGQTMTFEVKRGVTNFNVSQLSKIPDVNYLAKDPKYKNSFMNTGGAPPGDYKICVELRKADNSVLGDDCFEQKIMGGDAPQLISPRNGEELRADNPVFTWMHMKGPGSTQTYKIKIVEIKGDESPENAMLKNKAFFEKEGITTQMLQYPVSADKFEAGKKYAWQVSIGDLKSEVSDFMAGKNQSGKKNNCEANCLTNSIILNTGYNRTTGSVNAAGIYEEMWVLVGTPDSTISVPRIPTVITPNGAWVTQPNSGWISPYPTNALNANNAAPKPFYMYEACFCLCENSTVNLNMTIAADDAYEFSLDGTVISSVTSLAYGHTTAVNHTATLNAGTHCLRIGIRNLGGVAMGLNVTGTITGANLLSQACCNNKSKLTGMKFNDLNCNGVKDANEPGLSGWTIQLNNGQSKVTDAGGFYTFTDLDAGNYIVTEVNQAGWTQTMPSAGNYNVTLGAQQVISNLDFGNCEGASNPCDSLKANVSASPLQGCCWSLNLQTPVNNSSIKGIQFLAQAPNSFVTGSSSLGSAYNSGWIFPVNNAQEFKIKKLAGNIPSGQLNGFFNFCLNKLSSPQHVIINWLSSTDSVICSDTVTTYCEIPCVTFTKDTLLCNGSNYNLQYSFTNNASFPIGKIDVVSSPAGITVTPATQTLSPALNSGLTTNQPQFSISGAVPNTQACFVLKFTSPDGCCWCYDTLCVNIPSCMCNEVGATISGDPLNCCYSLNLQNNFSGNYFNQVNVRTLESGVSFNTWNTNTANNWYSTNVYPDNVIHLITDPANFPNGYLPMGNLANVINFCLQGYTASSQHIIIEWMRNDSVKCRDTLTTNCTPLPPETPCTQLINDSLTCLPNGTYQYTFHVKNNSSHTTTGFQFNPISPSGVVFTSANFSNVTIAPGMISPQQTMIISGIAPGSQFCFNISLYEHVLITGQQYYDWCCYSTEICKTVPTCTPPNECKFEVMIDSVKCKQNAAGQWYYAVSTRINNMSGSHATLNSVLADNGNMNCTPVNLATGMNLINCNYTFTGSPVNPVCFTYRILKPGSTDTCKYKLCRALPVCNPPPGCNCNNGKWDAVNNVIRYNQSGVSTDNVIACNGTYTIDAGSSVSLFSKYICAAAGCTAKYTYRINGGAMTGFQTSPYNILNITSSTAAKIYAWCGDVICDSCTITINPKPAQSGCECGEWKGKEIQVNINDKKEHPITCGDELEIKLNDLLILDFPEFVCKPKDCSATYSWDLSGGSGIVPVHVTSSDIPFKHEFTTPGLYTLSYKAYCGGKACDSCIVRIKVTSSGVGNCDCGGWAENRKGFTIHGFNGSPDSEIETFIKCESTYKSIYKGVALDMVAQEYFCLPKEKCNASYTWKITSPSGVISNFTSKVVNGFIFSEVGLYKVTLVPVCGSKRCDECTSVIKVIKKGDDK